ncbi:IS21-like element helper ATPase IstB [Plesiomonas sp.]|uniref:IS21-like element helper ATPase IstB n=1 Tax=Plesiomonas sp. TaxID=2486279 RepID=UPI003F3E0793
MTKTELLKDYANRLRLYHLKTHLDKIIHQAQIEKLSYLEFLYLIFEHEIQSRDAKDLERRLKSAALPPKHDLDNFDYNYSNGVTKPQMTQLRELLWLEQTYNVIIMGPSGTGKTYLAAGLVYEAVKQGYKAYLMTMEEIITIIKMKEISPSAMISYNKLLRAHLIAIDDIMLLPVKREDAVGFFNLINALHEKTSIIITTNKAPTEWVQTLDDEVITTALLDRLLYKCEVIKLSGTSYRFENRKTIFNQ